MIALAGYLSNLLKTVLLMYRWSNLLATEVARNRSMYSKMPSMAGLILTFWDVVNSKGRFCDHLNLNLKYLTGTALSI